MPFHIGDDTPGAMPGLRLVLEAVVEYLWSVRRPLPPQADAHYAGKGISLGAPNTPIFWYKPTGAEKYRVIYADLSVKELTPAEVKKLPEAKDK